MDSCGQCDTLCLFHIHVSVTCQDFMTNSHRLCMPHHFMVRHCCSVLVSSLIFGTLGNIANRCQATANIRYTCHIHVRYILKNACDTCQTRVTHFPLYIWVSLKRFLVIHLCAIPLKCEREEICHNARVQGWCTPGMDFDTTIIH